MSVTFTTKFGINLKTVFTPEPVKVRLDAATYAKLSQVGQKVRMAAKSSIRRVPQKHPASPPGHPPYSPTGFLKASIFYGIDKARRAVVVGPVPLRGKRNTAQRALEYGGRSITAAGKPIRIQQRPFMTPAFGAVLQRDVPAVFKNSLK
jgi:hypothetical protein